ncbi:MAG: F0F1 ATP synthase subunit B [Nitrospinaceae bacterium]|nr:F0F1 ATP synthase subunit B [Nitrospinaceae bacterium]NIR53942.1 F0F1 ATP synthase subunit B [Nitrospinaceae bacterium]NIS84360.1 F0F1 ATP synthase subunit B [Nitrospinaceae bacterium]NIT81162.1 F0F1 ATP synthase subunit B [Nitrospinaceae bacterium]NIU43445.1 F0F1 ATP synthase subunit B [Nitrospinaceae bacterium]
MQTDWVTISAQLINFLILVALLKKFLYHRILKAMDDREARIARHLEDAEHTQKEAEDQVRTYEQKNRELQELWDKKLSEAEWEAENRKKDLIHQARSEVDQMQRKWEEALRRDRDHFLNQLRRLAGLEVCRVSRRALADLADADLERRTLHSLLQRLQDLGPEENKALQDSLRKSGKDLQVRTRFEPDLQTRKEVTQALRDQFGEDVRVNYETSDALVLGAELLVYDYKIAWTVENYLEELEKKFTETLTLPSDSPGPEQVESGPDESNRTDRHDPA